MFDVLVYALLRKYIKDSLVGAGALKGASCQIQSITRNDDNNANIVTYKWEDNAGGLHTSQMVVYDGAIGPKGDKGDAGDKGNKGDKGDTGKGITNIEQLDDSNQIIVHYDDGTQEGPFTIPTIKGDPGEDGVDGETPTVEVGTVETVDYTAGAEITPRETPTGIVLDFKIPRGRPGEGGESAIADMTDVVLSNLKTGQILKYDKETGKWYNADGVEINELGDIKDVALSNLKAGQTLIWDAENSKWKNADAVNPTQFDTMPEASEYATKVIQYTGADTANYKRGYFYRSTPSIVSGELVYSWVQTNTQPSNNDYEDLANKPAVNGVELSGDKTSDDLGIQGKIQFTALPLASSANRGKIIQYVGASTDVLKKGYWYTCTYNSDSDTFSWVESDISGNTELANRIATLEQNQGDMTQIEVATATSLVDALNKLNAKGQIDRYEYNEPYLIIYYHDGHTFQVSVGTILNDLQIGELANVIDETITDGQILQYDSSIQKYKPYAILATLQTLLQNAKDYADEEILKAIQVGAYVCDEKPQYDAENDTVIYKQGGAIKTTTNTSARFYYTIIGEGSFFTSWIEDVEFTSSVAAVNFDDYVNKNTDVVSDYSEDMVDKTKIPDIASLDALLTIVKTALGLKVNTADIIDNLTSVDTTKPLSANQGKVLKDELDTKQKQIQYTEMPVASVDWLGETLQYKGATSSAFTHNMWYECKYDNTAAEYYWDEVKYGADVDSELDEKSSNPVANSVLTPEIKSRLKQYSVMPEPSLALFKAIVQYTGDTNNEYTNGLFYKCLKVGNEFVWSPINSSGRYNVLDFGLKGDNVTDNSSAFSSLLSKVPYGAVIYFPSGMYRFESPIVLTKGVSLVGDTNFDKMPVPNSATYRPISGIIFAGSTENTTFITRSSGLSCSFSNLSFYCAGKDDSLNSYKISNNDEAFVSLPYPFFKESMDREAVNGLDMNNSGALAVHDCTFAGFTGFALSITQHIFVDRCDFRNCNIGIRVSATDCWISNCHFVGGGIGVFSPQTLSNILINISDTWFDQMAHNAIRLESGSNVILANNLWIDMIDEAGICVPNGSLRRSNITGRLSRCGMSYAGLESESWSTAVSPYADAISAYTLYNSYINVSVERRAIGLGNNSTGVCAHYVIGITHNDILNECNIITDTSADYVSNGRGNGSTINANGKMTFRNNIFDYKYAPILFRSKTPKSFVTPFESDILSIDSSTGKIYKSNGTTKEDWEELHCGDKTFPGTLEEWNALTPAEKAKYDFVVTPEEANTKAPFEDITSQIVLQNGTDGNPLFTSGSGTDWDIFSGVKYGNVVVFSVCFGTFSGKVNSGYVCFRGLPKAALPAETGGSFDTRWFINKNDNYIQLYFSRPSSELENTATRFQLVYFTND